MSLEVAEQLREAATDGPSPRRSSSRRAVARWISPSVQTEPSCVDHIVTTEITRRVDGIFSWVNRLPATGGVLDLEALQERASEKNTRLSMKRGGR